jgi:octanoyl-[GcvH]:protein N-octanoyltransferase
MARTVHVVRDSFTGRPALDTALSHALLERASAGELAETLRIWRPDAIVTFGRLDAVAPGYHDALAAAHREGFAAVERLEGGRAAVFHEQTVAFAHTLPDAHPMDNTHARFEATAELMAAALARLGVEARVGEIPREYCPGAYSVNAGGRRKLMGVGQRVIARAAHVGGVVVVAQGERVRAVLEPVYRALGLDWDPATAGAVSDESAGVTYEQVEAAIIAEYARSYELVDTALDEETSALAAELEGEHEAPARSRNLGGVGATHS